MKKKESLEDIYDEFMKENKSKSEVKLIGEEKVEYEPEEDKSLELEVDEKYQPLNTESLEVENFEPVSEDNEEELQKEIFSNEIFQEVEKVLKDKEEEAALESSLKECIFESEDYKEIEKILEAKEIKGEVEKESKDSSDDRKIVTAIIIVILLFIIAIVLFLLFKNKEDKNKKNSTGQSSTVKELPYQEVMNKYGDKITEQIELYYIKNNKLPETIPTVKIEGYTIVCEIEEIYSKDNIYLDKCKINESENIYSYGEIQSVIDTNTNATSNSNSMSNSNSTSNKPNNSNSTSNKPTNSNKPSSSNSSTNKPTNSNTNIKPVTTGMIVSSAGSKTANSFGGIPIIPKNTPIAGDYPLCKTETNTVEGCYGSSLLYDKDGSLILNGTKSSTLMKNISSNSKVEDNYSVNLTVKGDVNQGDKWGSAIIGISFTDTNYLLWIGYRNGELIVYSYGTNSSEGGKTIPFQSYNNKVVNIQVTAKRGGDTRIYVNGKFIQKFESGSEKLAAKFVTVGDLRPGRGLKFDGNLYEFILYDRVLTEKEITTNYEAAKKSYNIK